MRTFIWLVASIALTGCLSKMERITEETKASVQASNKLIADTKDGQALGEALNLMSNREISYDLRIAAAETVVTKAPEDRVWKYAGLPAPHNYVQTERELDGKTVKFSNVTLISESKYANPETPEHNFDQELTASLKDQDLYFVQSASALNLLEQISLKSKGLGLTATDMDYLRVTSLRVMPIAAGLLGGMRAAEFKKSIRENRSRPFEKDIETRLRAAKLMMEICHRLSLTESQISTTRIDIQDRLGVDVP